MAFGRLLPNRVVRYGQVMPIALITGATSGIGAAFARQLAVAGYSLVLVARDEQRLAERRAACLSLGSPAVELLPADLTDAGQRDRVVARLAAVLDPIDLLINNAGLALGQDFLEADQRSLLTQLDLNVTAVMILTHAVLPGMIARRRGGVINVGSIAGLLPGRGSTYAGSKAFVISFSEGLSMSLRGTGIRVQALCPGFVKTEFHQRAGIDMAKIPDRLYVDIDTVVTTSLADLRANRPVSIPGALYQGIAVVTRLLPRGVVRSLASKVNHQSRN